MLPLDPLASISPIDRLLLRARAPEAAAELTRLEHLAGSVAAGATPVHATLSAAAGSGAEAGSASAAGDTSAAGSAPAAAPAIAAVTASMRAAITFARGALALREGSLGPALADFEAAAADFAAAGDTEAAELARAEALLSKMRRGPRPAFVETEAALAALAAAATSPRARVVATHYRGAALRLLGDAQATQKTLLAALALAEAHPPERPRILNSLGTLYVVLGAYGAAEALLEHAAELHHQRGDAVGEAIACGQLGAAALGLGDLAKARTWLQRQEWLASQVGDAFGRARALTFLADVALDLGRPDDALELANLARDVARSTTPPLAIWLAYATRSAGRARADLADPQAEAELRDARTRFTRIGNPLGLALTEWDLVRLLGPDAAGTSPVTAPPPAASAPPVTAPPPAASASPAASAPPATAMSAAASAPPATATSPAASAAPGATGGDGASEGPLSWSGPAWALASLGLSARVAGLLHDHAARAGVISADDEETFFAVAQPAPHLSVPREIALVYEAPAVLGAVSSRRTAAQRNLARLGALTLAPPGLEVATITWTGAPRYRPLPPERAAGAAIGALPGVAQWAWPLSAPPADITRDLDALTAALTAAGAANVTVTRARHPNAHIVSPPFAGEVAATVEGLDDP